ncbi:MAG: DUF2341 domain-containing protein [bacterium]
MNELKQYQLDLKQSLWRLGVVRALLLVVTLVWNPLQVAGQDSWYYSGWSYRRSVTVTNNTTSALTDHQVLVSLTSANFDFSHPNSDGSDIRFTYWNGASETEIPYWIERWDSGAQQAKVWTKVPNIRESDTSTIYLYYGNLGASSASNGDATFDIFEDFNVDDDEWTEYDPNNKIELDYTVDHRLEFTNWKRTDPGYVYKAYSIPENFVEDFEIKITGHGGNANPVGPAFTNYVGNIASSSSTSNIIWTRYTEYSYVEGPVQGSQILNYYCKNGQYSESKPIMINQGTLYYVRVTKSGDSVTLSVFDDSDRTSHIPGSPVTNVINFSGISFDHYYPITAITEGPVNWEWTDGWTGNYKVRKYTEPEPTVAVGAEENSLTGSISGKVTESDGMTAIEGATVLALDGTGTVKGSTTTSVAGTYSICNLSLGTYSIAAAKGSYATRVKGNIVVTAGTETLGVDFQLPEIGPRGGKIVFCSYRNGNYDIYTMNADGSNLTRLTNDPAADECPKWSKNGTKIAFLSNRTGSWQIWVMDADGSNLRQVTNVAEAVYLSDFSWYPGDQKIAFIKSGYYLCSINIDGSNLTEIISPEGSPFPAPNGCDVSPDGTRFVVVRKFTGWGHDIELFIYDIVGKYLGTLTWTPMGDKTESQSPAWSPAGDKIAFEGIRHFPAYPIKNIFVINPDGSNLGTVTDFKSGNGWEAGKPRWSPDGQKIIFYGQWETSPNELYIINKDGSNLRRITNNSFDDIHPDWIYGYVSPTSGSISGKVIESDGMTAIEGATVLALDGTGTVKGSTTTSAAGTYSITGLPEGTYTVRVSKSGYLATETSGVVVKAGTETTGVNFILYSAKIKPIVSSPQSAGSEVWVKIQVGDEGEPVENLHHLKFNLHYTNFDILDVLEVKHGDFLGDDPIFQEDHSSPGTVTVFIGRKPTEQGVTGYGNVVLVKFKLSAEAQPGTISVSFSKVEAYGTQSWVSLLPESDEFVTNRVTIKPEVSSPQPAGVKFLLTIQVGDEDNQVTELSNVVYELVWDRPDIIQVVKPLYENITAGEFIGRDSLILTGGGNGTLSICVARKGGGVNGYGTVTNIWLKVLDQSAVGEEIKFTLHKVSAYGSESNRIGLASGSCTLTVDVGTDTAEVWPGDTDNDGIVALWDIIPIVWYWWLQATGPARWSDETPLEIRIKWEKQLAIKWGIVIPPFPDACYADTDGNGIVKPEDIIAVAVNWGKTQGGRLMMPAPARAMSIYEIDHSKFIKCYEEMLAVLTGLPDDTPGKEEVERQICKLIEISNPAIFKVYPNPYRPTTTHTHIGGIKFENLGTNWDIKIYNIASELVSEMHGTENDYIWLTAKDFASGVYIYIVNSSTLSKKIGKLAIIK